MSDSHILDHSRIHMGQFWDGTSTILTYLRAYLECHLTLRGMNQRHDAQKVALVDPQSTLSRGIKIMVKH